MKNYGNIGFGKELFVNYCHDYCVGISRHNFHVVKIKLSQGFCTKYTYEHAYEYTLQELTNENATKI